MRHAHGNANGDGHIYSDGNSDCNGYIHSDGDSNSDADANTNGNGNGDRYSHRYSNGDCDRIAAGYTNAAASGDTAASPLAFFGITGTRERRTREFLAQSGSHSLRRVHAELVAEIAINCLKRFRRF